MDNILLTQSLIEYEVERHENVIETENEKHKAKMDKLYDVLDKIKENNKEIKIWIVFIYYEGRYTVSEKTEEYYFSIEEKRDKFLEDRRKRGYNVTYYQEPGILYNLDAKRITFIDTEKGYERYKIYS